MGPSVLRAPPHVLIIEGTADERTHEARLCTHAPLVVDAAALPFTRVSDLELPPPPRTILIEGIERAFPDNQVGSTRLVLTQSTYLMQQWIDALGAGDRIVATADRAALEQCAPEALQGRGPWRRFAVVDNTATGVGDRGLGDYEEDSRRQSLVSGRQWSACGVQSPSPPVPSPLAGLLAAAYASRDPAERLQLCHDAAARDPEVAVVQLALASAYREHHDLRARDALERAADLRATGKRSTTSSGSCGSRSTTCDEPGTVSSAPPS